MKSAIIYYSKHHQNTKKMLDAIAEQHEITLIDASKTNSFDLNNFELIGFASGIYYWNFHRSVIQFAETQLPQKRQVFFIFTAGTPQESFTRRLEKIALQKSCQVRGSFGCVGFDSFGPLKLLGGIHKDRPNQEDLAEAVRFYEGLLSPA